MILFISWQFTMMLGFSFYITYLHVEKNVVLLIICSRAEWGEYEPARDELVDQEV